QGDRCVGQPAGVDDRGIEIAPVQSIDQGAFVVRLEEVDLEPELAGSSRDFGMDVIERVAAVDLRLARAEEVQVRALEDEDVDHDAAASAAVTTPGTSRDAAA